MPLRIAINGFGRIGRLVLRAAQYYDNLEIVAINDLTEAATLAYLLQYDSVHGRFPGEVKAGAGYIAVNGQKIVSLMNKDVAQLPWQELKVNLVVEATGCFTRRNEAARHLKAGAGKVLITAPAHDEDITIVPGVNEQQYDPTRHDIVSGSSCTTNCLLPVVKVLHEEFGIQNGLVTTVHSYTNDQNVLDLPHRDLRRARAAGLSLIPTTTGAAGAVGLLIPELQNRFNGLALRVPTPDVSLIDLTVQLQNRADREQVNDAFGKWAVGRLQGILSLSTEPLVSCDYRGDAHSAIVDGLSTLLLDDRLLKVLAWYDNEWAYANRMVELAAFMYDKECQMRQLCEEVPQPQPGVILRREPVYC